MNILKILNIGCVLLLLLSTNLYALTNNHQINDIKIHSSRIDKFIFDDKYSTHEFYNTFWTFNALMTTVYIVEELRPINHHEIDKATINLRTKIILSLLNNATIKNLMLNPKLTKSGFTPLPMWAYWMVSPILKAEKNLNFIQKNYGDKKKQDFIHFVTNFSYPRPAEVGGWHKSRATEQDYSSLILMLIQEIISDTYPENDYIISLHFKEHLNFIAARFFIVQLIEDKDNKELQKWFYIFLQNSSEKELMQLLQTSLRNTNSGKITFPASYEMNLNNYSLLDLAKIWKQRIQKLHHK